MREGLRVNKKILTPKTMALGIERVKVCVSCRLRVGVKMSFKDELTWEEMGLRWFDLKPQVGIWSSF